MAAWIERENLNKNSEEWNNMCCALKLWPSLHSFMLKGKVDNNYKKEIKTFESKVEEFYDYGANTFLMSANGEVGYYETSYMHILRFNLAELAKITYDRHKLGIGVFTLQGYERRNRESKFIYDRHCNNRGNLCYSTMKRLTEKFIRHFDLENNRDGSSKTKKKAKRKTNKEIKKEETNQKKQKRDKEHMVNTL